MTAVNWTAMFSGFSDIGTVIGDFVVNLITGLAPAIILLILLAGIAGIIYACFKGVQGMLGSSMKGHKRG
jgi:hypothetical protein